METNARAEIDIVENWLNAVNYSHSGSVQTTKSYRLHLRRFLEYIGKSANQLQTDYSASQDRDFKRKYAQYLMGYLGQLQAKKYSPGSIEVAANSIKSFFKYSDFPLGFTPKGSGIIENHNRDILKTEIVQVLQLANVRDRAFFMVLAQSGLRPGTIAHLRISDVEKILENNPPIPCLITVRSENTKGKFSEYFSFVGAESVANLKDYLRTRSNLTPDKYLFTAFGSEEKAVQPGVLTHIFRRLVEKLRSAKVLDYKTNTKALRIENKDHTLLRGSVSRGELRLYNLRKFFRKFAGQAGADYVNFWMGHSNGVDDHYFSRDVEMHRKVYAEKAMPFLRLETKTPSESERQIEDLRKQILELNEERKKLMPLLEFAKSFENENEMRDFLTQLKNAPLNKVSVSSEEYIPILEVKDGKFLKKLEDLKETPEKERLDNKATEYKKLVERGRKKFLEGQKQQGNTEREE
jgi:integrase